jgi:uncharacterized protein (DUF2141 family)
MRTVFVFFSLLAIVSAALAADGDDHRATLHITVENLKNDKGQVVIALFANKQDYLKQPVGEAAVSIGEDLTSQTEFSDLPAGTYAVAVYHDKNKNGDLDTFLVVPREDYGFSNDARSPFGPPSFKSASFEFDGVDDLHITIRSK